MASQARVSLAAGRIHRTELVGALRASLPLWGSLIAAALIFSRRPDALTNAQFWAEDGKLYYANVYNHGLLQTLLVPQAGCFQTLPVIAARFAQIWSVVRGPLIMNLIGIAVRVLPVGLLLSRRAETISPDLRVRALLALLYIALPGSAETNANAVNACWYLAVAALIVLMLRAPTSLLGRAVDVAILGIFSVTGVFVIALAPLAYVYRRLRGARAVSNTNMAILAVGALIQLFALLVLQYHPPAGFNAAPRPSGALNGSVQVFLEIFGLRIVAQPILGNAVVLTNTASIFLGALGIVTMAMAFRLGSDHLKLLIAFGAAVLAMSLARPLGTDWPGLISPIGLRYFVIPQFAAVAALVWAWGRNRHGGWLMLLATIFLCMFAISIPNGWKYQALGETGWEKRASQFERSPSGTTMTFPIEPSTWSMTLLKH